MSETDNQGCCLESILFTSMGCSLTIFAEVLYGAAGLGTYDLINSMSINEVNG